MSILLLCIIIVSVFIMSVNWFASQYSDRADIQYRKQNRPEYGYIYFYRGRGENPFWVKIGRTNNWNNRLKSARTSVSPKGLHIYGVLRVKDDVFAEKFIHDKYASQRVTRKNEWFSMSIGLYLYILRVRNPVITREARERLEILDNFA